MSRAYTPEEVRDMFLQHVKQIVTYWATLEGSHSIEDRCDGVAFSILSTLDGASPGLPALDLIPSPHPEDRAYHKQNGENYFVKKVINNCQLHEHYCSMHKYT